MLASIIPEDKQEVSNSHRLICVHLFLNFFCAGMPNSRGPTAQVSYKGMAEISASMAGDGFGRSLTVPGTISFTLSWLAIFPSEISATSVPKSC